MTHATTPLSHPSDVLNALLPLSDTSGRGQPLGLAAMIDACGAYISQPDKRVIGDREETVFWLDSCAFSVPLGVGRAITWYERPPGIDDLPWVEPGEFMMWANGWDRAFGCAMCKNGPGRAHHFLSTPRPESPRSMVHLCSRCGARWPDRTPKFVALGEVSPNMGELPWLGDAGDRLRKMTGLTRDDFYQQVLPLNVLPTPLAARPSRVPHRLFLRLHGMSIEPILTGAQLPIVAFGRSALEALEDLSPRGESFGFQVFNWRGLPVYALPHPSGRCRTYNDTTMREQAAALLARLLTKESM
jgi:hypothetical protein